MTKTIFTSIATVAAFFGTAGIAQAGTAKTTPEGARAMEISYADLDLSSAQGQEALARRINVAARQVCGAAGSADLRTSMAASACQKRAVTQANARIAQLRGVAVLASR